MYSTQKEREEEWQMGRRGERSRKEKISSRPVSAENKPCLLTHIDTVLSGTWD
jgi:hypothetical protein